MGYGVCVFVRMIISWLVFAANPVKEVSTGLYSFILAGRVSFVANIFVYM